MNASRFCSLFAASAALVCFSSGQVTLTSFIYEQDFDALETGLPDGWNVYLSATETSLGSETSFTSSATIWSSTSPVFRNIASFEGALSTDNTATQVASPNRALGWRPNSVASRNGAVALHLANTLGYRDFNIEVTLFTGNNVGSGDQSYNLEYRIGETGSFTSIASYTTSAPFSPTTLSVSSVTLSALNDQSDAVFFRLRGTSTSGTSNLDTLGIDNFSLTYSAVPEPSTYAAILGGLSLIGVIAYKRRRKA